MLGLTSEFLQLLHTPHWKWNEIFINFVVGLPRTHQKHYTIWVAVDQLTMLAHFLPIKVTNLAKKLAQLYVELIISLHGISKAIVFDRDPKFTSRRISMNHLRPN